MRAAVAVVLIVLFLPAVAQAQKGYLTQRDFTLDAQAAQARQRDVVIQNELMSLDARLRTEQELRIGAPLATGPIHILPMPISAPPPVIGPFAAIPDARLAASNERVRAAARNRR